jgi:hypothetical protein
MTEKEAVKSVNKEPVKRIVITENGIEGYGEWTVDELLAVAQGIRNMAGRIKVRIGTGMERLEKGDKNE